MTSSAAASAFRVSSPSDGGQSINTKSYHSLTARRASRSLCSRDGTPTSSTSAPARWILDGARSSPFTGDGISAEAMATPLMRTSYSEVPTDARETPTPLVACACGSLSTSKTCVPERARAADTLTAVVDFPTPPFWFAMAMTRPIDQTPHSVVPAISLRTSRQTERKSLEAQRTFHGHSRPSRVGRRRGSDLGDFHHRPAHATRQLCVMDPPLAASEQRRGAPAWIDFPPHPRALEQNGLPAHAHEGEGEFTQGREWATARATATSNCSRSLGWCAASSARAPTISTDSPSSTTATSRNAAFLEAASSN